MPHQLRRSSAISRPIPTISRSNHRNLGAGPLEFAGFARKHRQFRTHAMLAFALWLGCIFSVTGHVHHATGRVSDQNHRHGAHGCGSDAPHVQKLEKSAPFVPVRYDSPNPSVLGTLNASDATRRLQTSYMNIEVADAAGVTRPIRIFLDWNILDTNNDAQQCVAVGQLVSVSDGTKICSASDVIVSGSGRLALIKQRTAWAAEYWSKTLRVQPATSAIRVDSSITAMFPSATPTINGADLVVIITARVSVTSSVAAYSVCLQRDQHGRCTVGWLNWVPNYINTASALAPDVIAGERETAVHEFVHILGGMRPSPAFVNADTGVPMMTGGFGSGDGLGTIYDVDTGEGFVPEDLSSYDGPSLVPYFRKATTWITSPRVRAAAREQFGCSVLKGVPLEDIPLGGGAGSHWEARVMGPEIMSYGRGSGESYVSDITLAFLEDTGQYRANYSMAGRLTDFDQLVATSDTCDGLKASSALEFMLGKPETRVELSPNNTTPFTRGTIRWGHKEGCNFVIGSPVNWPSYYICDKNGESMCTPDNRMVAQCVVRMDWTLSYSDASWGDIRSATGTLTTGNCTPAGCPINPLFQYFGARGESAGRIGGFSQAMDFVPVAVGSWNCQDIPGDAANVTARRLSSTSLEYFIADSPQSNSAAGQCRCTTCRCLRSSLHDITGASVFQSAATSGQCYKTNCVTNEYLQVGVRDTLTGEIRWSKCPPGGGAISVPGYTGRLHCPDPVKFCQLESASGIRYPEAVTWQLWATVVVTLLLPGLACVLCSCPYTRRRVCMRMKPYCFVVMYNRRLTDLVSPKTRKESTPDIVASPVHPSTVVPVGGKTGSALLAAERSPQASPSVAITPRAHHLIRGVRPARGVASVLVLTNSLTILLHTPLLIIITVLVIAGRMSLAASPLLLLSAMFVGTSVLGITASRKRTKSVSCSMASFFFAAVTAIVTLAVTTLVLISGAGDVGGIVADNWSLFSVLLKGHYKSSTPPASQLHEACQFMRRILPAVIVMVLVQLALFAVGVRQAVKFIGTTYLSAMTVSVLHLLFVLIGFLAMLLGGIVRDSGVMMHGLTRFRGEYGDFPAALVSCGVLLMVYSTVGLHVIRKRLYRLMHWYGMASLVIVVLSVVASIACFASISNISSVATRVYNPQDAAFYTKDQLEHNMKSFLVACGFMLLVFAGLWVALVVALAAFLHLLHQPARWSTAVLQGTKYLCGCHHRRLLEHHGLQTVSVQRSDSSGGASVPRKPSDPMHRRVSLRDTPLGSSTRQTDADVESGEATPSNLLIQSPLKVDETEEATMLSPSNLSMSLPSLSRQTVSGQRISIVWTPRLAHSLSGHGSPDELSAVSPQANTSLLR